MTKRTMTFKDGRVIVRGGDKMPVIEPISNEVNAEELDELFERHEFSQIKIPVWLVAATTKGKIT